MHPRQLTAPVSPASSQGLGSYQLMHPSLSSVLFLSGPNSPKQQQHRDEGSGSTGGGPTVVLEQTPGSPHLAERAWVAHPLPGRYLVFSGDLLHGVLPEADERWEVQRGQRGSDEEGQQPPHQVGACSDQAGAELGAEQCAFRTTLMLAWWAEGTGPKAHTAAAAEGAGTAEGAGGEFSASAGADGEGSSSSAEDEGREGDESSRRWGWLRPSMLAPACPATTSTMSGQEGRGTAGDHGGGGGGSALDSADRGSGGEAAAGALALQVRGGTVDVSGSGAATTSAVAVSEPVAEAVSEAGRCSSPGRLLWPQLFKATPKDLTLIPHGTPSSPSLPAADVAAVTSGSGGSGPRPCGSSPSRPAQEVRPAWQLIETPPSGLDHASPRPAVQAELPGLDSHPRLADQADLPVTHPAARPTVQAALPGLHFFIRSLDEFKQLYVPES